MSKEQILEWYNVNSISLTTSRILLIMLFGLIVSFIIFATYKITYRGVAYNARFNVTNVVILLVSIVIMLMISSNIVISLGMVGALSVIRYRTAIKDPRDTAFIFWSVVEGLCVGSQNYKLSIISVLLISIILISVHFVHSQNNKYLIVIRGRDCHIDVSVIQDILKELRYSTDIRTMNCSETYQEIILEAKKIGRGKETDISLAGRLMEVEGVCSVNCLVESGDTIG